MFFNKNNSTDHIVSAIIFTIFVVVIQLYMKKSILLIATFALATLFSGCELYNRGNNDLPPVDPYMVEFEASYLNGDYYGVPYRSLLASGVEQLLLAGRCVSADSTAAGAIRVMPPCMAMGQAAGTAAAMAVKQKITVRNVNVQELRETLRTRKVYLG